MNPSNMRGFGTLEVQAVQNLHTEVNDGRGAAMADQTIKPQDNMGI